MALMTDEQLLADIAEIQKTITENLGETLGIGIILTNRAGHFLWGSEYLLSIFETQTDGLKDNKWLQFLSEKDARKLSQQWNSCAESLDNLAWECQLITATQKERWVKFSISPYQPEDGSGCAGFIIMVEDITLSRIKDEELYLQADLLSEVNDAVIVLNANNKVSYWNSGAEKLYKVKADEIVGHKLIDAFEYKWKRPHQKEVAKKDLLETGYHNGELIHQLKDGTSIHVEVSMHLHYDSSTGKRTGITSIVRDITARKEAELDLKKTYRYIKLLLNRAEEENQYLKKGITPPQYHDFDEIITNSPKMRAVLKQIEQVAISDATVLILGETGTGKELLARAVHTHSKRKEGPLVKVNCAALPSELIESELFGHEKGAFTGAISQKIGRFELAEGGTIFLDEVGELPLELQAKLLRVLQEGEFERLGSSKTHSANVRVIAATNRDLKQEVNAGEFRSDLYYRLNVFPIYVPPLRERSEDVLPLVEFFVKKYSKAIGKEINRIPTKVMQQLERYDWPGNIRELENIAERAVIISTGKSLQMGNWLDQERLTVEQNQFVTLAEKEAQYIRDVLEKVNWKISGAKSAAEILGMKSTTLRSRMEKLGIKRPF